MIKGTQLEKRFHRNILKRRLLHIAASIIIMYYLLPKKLPYIGEKHYLLLAGLTLVIGIELYRWYTAHYHPLDPLLREYEQRRPASYVYFSVGSVILILLFPQYITIPCILSTAFCDPLIGIVRKKTKQCNAYILGFIVSFFLFAIVWLTTLWWIMLTASFLGASMIILAEYSSTLHLDDDLLMQLMPAIILFFLAQILLKSALPLPNQILYPF